MARHSRPSLLWQIRSTVDDEECLITRGDSVRFSPDTDFWLDVDEFEWTIEQASPGAPERGRSETDLLSGAIELYRGDLLAGFYDDWLFSDQERLRQRFLGTLGRLADLAMARGDYDQALEIAHQVARSDLLSEEAHRRIMRIAVLLGRHTDAIRQYERCQAILDTEPWRRLTPRYSTRMSRHLWSAETGSAPLWQAFSTGYWTVRAVLP